jgi:hypothetical protein
MELCQWTLRIVPALAHDYVVEGLNLYLVPAVANRPALCEVSAVAGPLLFWLCAKSIVVAANLNSE